MTRTNDPWRGVEPPEKDDALNIRRADPGHPLDYWFARDVRGRFAFCFDADIAGLNTSALPRLASIELVALRIDQTRCRLVLTLQDSEQLDIFRALCSDLMRATNQLSGSESAAALMIIVSRLRRWQELLERARDGLLRQSVIIGLVGELFFLRDLLLPRLNAFDAIQSWRGPYRDQQDFLLEGKMFEVKTQLSTSDRYLSIGSEEQLDTASGPIVVCHQTVDVPASEGAGACSLNALVSSIMEAIPASDYTAADLFQSALLEAGYRRRGEYDRPYWLLNVRSFYEVRDGFPRIVPNMIGSGIDSVRYRIALQACLGFEISEEKALE